MAEMNCGHEGAGTVFTYKDGDEEIKLVLCHRCFLIFLEMFLEIYNGCTKKEKQAFHWLFNEWRKSSVVRNA